jgi:hypothetical protein
VAVKRRGRRQRGALISDEGRGLGEGSSKK